MLLINAHGCHLHVARALIATDSISHVLLLVQLLSLKHDLFFSFEILSLLLFYPKLECLDMLRHHFMLFFLEHSRGIGAFRRRRNIHPAVLLVMSERRWTVPRV